MSPPRGPGRVVLAPDSFKGSVSAAEVAAALARGVRAELPDVEVVEHPIADGGEGTVDAVVRAGLRRVEATVSGPLGQPVQGAYAVAGREAVVELAEAAGLGRLPPSGPSPVTARTATTRGVGELVLHAAENGATTVTLGIGGSCTTDGGAGLVTALGARLLTADGRAAGPGGAGLLEAARLDLSRLDPRLRGVRLVVACDVDNPLLGPDGAAAVYAPQKGAGPEDVALLEQGLRRWADVVADATGTDLRDLPGAGAAGGVGFGLAALLGARLQPGAPLLLEATAFHRHLGPDALIVVGEGSFDQQSLRGKGPVAAARLAKVASARVVAVAGRSTVAVEDAKAVGVDAVFTLVDLEPDPRRCVAEAARLLEETGRRVGRWWAAQPP
ncbi:glycerate kinase [Pedococcus cremeus]|uniref:Glycerate kinase n=1 Tax=Pedococcus cremeus TaxID=587636 RepID=A0A1H9WL21_9MICO|nr:glycerate kinase [Pedococcus cremeus]SES34565.1 glycerate kinase [Pedococcus cremeus]